MTLHAMRVTFTLKSTAKNIEMQGGVYRRRASIVWFKSHGVFNSNNKKRFDAWHDTQCGFIIYQISNGVTYLQTITFN